MSEEGIPRRAIIGESALEIVPIQLKSRSSGYAKRLLRVSNWLARQLQRLDAWRLLVVHDEGTVVQLCDVGVELAQQPEHAGLVGFFLLLVEPAG